MTAFRHHVRQRGLTQAEAAEAVGWSKPRVSDLFTGKIDKFSIDALVNALARLGVDVEFVVGAVAEGTVENV